MAISLKPQHFTRDRQIAWIFMKYGRSDLVNENGLSETLAAEERVAPQEAAKANELATTWKSSGRVSLSSASFSPPGSSSCRKAYLEALA